MLKTHMQRDANDLFHNKENDIVKWSNCNFEIIIDENNEKHIFGKQIAKELKDIIVILEDMYEDWYNYEDEYKSYMIFGTDECYIGSNNLELYRKWINEIDDYYVYIIDKLVNYDILENEVEYHNAKVQIEKDVCLGVALALLRSY
jgi:hypothetical protein